jgi:hypothetical protein
VVGEADEALMAEETMDQPTRFADVLDAVGALSAEEQLTLVDIVTHRLAEDGRMRVVTSIHEARRECDAGQCRPATVDDLMNEISS